MAYEFLQPIHPELVTYVNTLPPLAFGRQVVLHTPKQFPELKEVKVVIIGISDNRGNLNFSEDSDLIKFRKQLYQLFLGNWELRIADLGNINKGASITDTYYLVKEIVADLLKNKIIPIVVGGSQDLTYALYRSYDLVEQMVNVAVIDSSFDFGNEVEEYTTTSYLSKIIVDEPNNLFNFSNLGYQTYYNSQYEIDLMDSLFFDAYRLGELSSDISLAEPVLRDSDLVSVDLQSVKSSDTGSFSPFVPNGFNGKEICSLARYAGISDKVSVFGIFNHHNLESEAALIAQMIWYFIEGVNFRSNEYPFGSRENYLKYTVLIEDMELVFFKSDKTDRWWIQIPSYENKVGKLQTNSLLPCSHNDYMNACKNEIPERWWKAYRKNIV